MQAVRDLRIVVVMAAVCGCAAHAGGAAPAAATASRPELAAPTPHQRMVDELNEALRRGDFEAAATAVDRARQAPPQAQPSPQALAYYDATVRAYRGDYRGAAKVMADHAAKVGPTAQAAFEFHDAMIALRTADGDLLGALVECEEMVKAGTLGVWTPSDGDRMTLVRLKEHWHRAYLLRMVAQTLTGAERQTFIAYAEGARRDYAALAAPLGLRDSIAVLDAYFAFCDGARANMREAALRVNAVEDDDIEDLYLVQLALDGAGDSAAAAAVRKRMLGLTAATVLTPVFLDWMRADDAPADQPRRFSPKHPIGARPAR